MKHSHILEEYEHFHALGYSDEYIARELGLKVTSLQAALRKARAR